MRFGEGKEDNNEIKQGIKVNEEIIKILNTL